MLWNRPRRLRRTSRLTRGSRSPETCTGRRTRVVAELSRARAAQRLEVRGPREANQERLSAETRPCPRPRRSSRPRRPTRDRWAGGTSRERLWRHPVKPAASGTSQERLRAARGETWGDSVRSGGQGIPPREGVTISTRRRHCSTWNLRGVVPSTCTPWGDRTGTSNWTRSRGQAQGWRRLGRAGRGAGERWVGTTSGGQAIDDRHQVVTPRLIQLAALGASRPGVDRAGPLGGLRAPPGAA